jgi:prepilin signal peptidase PulO-like enzyme (type II secretory pathway)
LFIFSKGKWVGLGDVILYFCFGMILTLPAAVSAFFYSVWIGAFVSIFLIVMYRRDYKFKSEVPFTPFIIIGAFMALYFNPDILYINDLIQIYGNF